MTAAEFTTRVDAHFANLRVAPGPSFGCRECGLEDVLSHDADAQARYDAACDSFFTWSRCPACGGLAGDRHAVHFWSDDGTIDGHEDVCSDCLLYIANGDVPDEVVLVR